MSGQKIIIGFTVIAAVMIAMVLYNAGGGFVYYYTVDEVKSKAVKTDKEIKVAGRLYSEPVRIAEDKPSYRFEITGGGKRIEVEFTGVLPDTLKTGREVVVQGRWTGKTLIASDLMTKCPSKYEKKLHSASGGGM